MAAKLSPGVTVTEQDFTQIVPSIATSVGAAVFHAEKGPLNVRTLITNPTDLVNIFGQPTDVNYDMWYNLEAFSKASGQLYVVRVEDSTKKVGGLTVGTTTTSAGNVVSSTSTTKTADLFPLTYSDIKTHEAKIDYNLATGSASGQLDNAANNLYTEDKYHFYGVGPGKFYENISVMVVNASDFSTLIELKSQLAEASTTSSINTICSNFYNGVPATSATDAIDYLTNSLVKYDLFTTPTNNNTNWFVDKALLNTLTAVQYGPTTSDEGILVVFDEYGNASDTYLFSNIVDKNDGLGNNMFGPKLVNGNNDKIYFFIGSSETAASGITLVSTRKTYLGGADLLTGEINGTSIADLTGEIMTAWQTYFSNPEDLSVDLLIDLNYADSIKQYIDQLAKEIRKDCMAILSMPLQYILNPTNYRPIAAPFTAMKNYVDNVLNINSSYSAIYGNFFKIFDRFNEKDRWVSVGGFIAGAMARNDFNDSPWQAVAGLNRGILSNISQIAVNPSKSQRDVLYYSRINPIVNFQGEGIVIWGQKTLQSTASAFDRINVRRLFLYLEKAISKMAKSFLFEFNDDFTRTRFRALVNPFLSEVKARRGVYDYLVVCDESNNTPQVIDSNTFVGDVYIKAARVAEFIQLNFINTPTGLDFSVIVPQRI